MWENHIHASEGGPAQAHHRSGQQLLSALAQTCNDEGPYLPINAAANHQAPRQKSEAVSAQAAIHDTAATRQARWQQAPERGP